MKKLSLFCGVFLLPLLAPAQNLEQKEKIQTTRLDSVVVESFRAGKNTPVSYSSLNTAQIKREPYVNSVPMVISLLPSVVSSTEGGNGLGYSSMRIRGSEGSRINVTLNGIALNDAESQEVFWVNIPSFTSFLHDIQVQRGVGTSVNGPGAFGASVNMRTLVNSSEPYGGADFGYGSYKTFLTTVAAGTGLSPRGFSFDIRASHNSGDGYIRNAKTALNSLFASLGWFKGDNYLKFNYILGDQKSGITWEGISPEMMEIDRRYNPAGEYYDKAGNVHYYDNEVDNFTQHHLQLHHAYNLKPGLVLNSTLHYTKGKGFYENYKYDKKFSSYNIPNQTIEGVTYSKSDFIIRQSIDNDYIAMNSVLSYNVSSVNLSAGVFYSYYMGDHFGDLLWSMYNNDIPKDYRWYLNNGYKHDYSFFVRGEFDLGEKYVAFADIQYRGIKYILDGMDKDFVSLKWRGDYNFFNPKLGLTYNLSKNNQLYGSMAVGRKEPGRSDIKESVKAGRASDIKPERVLDYEFGYRHKSALLDLSANLYLMEYKDQLVPTGKLSETGYVIKENVDKSYRRGIELSTSWRVLHNLSLDANLTLSKNKIKEYVQYMDEFDENWQLVSQKEILHKDRDISFSPSIISMAMISFFPTESLSLSMRGKYVGSQYMDNTEDYEAKIPQYFVAGFSASKSFIIKDNRNIELSLYIDNLLNRKYYSNGWIYSAQFITGERYREIGLYPQAEINYSLKLSFKF